MAKKKPQSRPPSDAPDGSPLNDRQRLFVAAYCDSLNATRAAIKAGYSEKTAAVIGYENLRKPQIAAEIAKRLQARAATPEEAIKRLADFVRADIADLFVLRTVPHTPQVNRLVVELLQELRAEVAFESEYAQRANLTGRELKDHQQAQQRREKQAIRYEMELERDPQATQWVQGKTTYITVAELDLVKAIEAERSGLIKSISYTRFGPRVELYAADAAVVNLLKLHGLFVERKDVTTNGEALPGPQFYLPDNGRDATE